MEGQTYDAWAGVAVEDSLAAFQLLPVNPVGDSVNLSPEFSERLIFRGSLSQELIYVWS